MDGFFEFKDRNVIPIWRDFTRTVQLGELTGNIKGAHKPEPTISRALFDWKENPSPGVAADLVNSAFVAGIFDNSSVQDAINMLRDTNLRAPNSLLALINFIEEKEHAGEERESNILLPFDTTDAKEIQRELENTDFLKAFHDARIKAHHELGNPIAWIELARFYSTINLQRKAERAILIALQIAPNNRFILRAATRFFIHISKGDKALFYLKKASGISNDPWLLSAHIATSSSLGRFSTMIKPATSLLESQNFSPFDLTELASSLGTLEFKDGQNRKAKALFNKSLIAPNDNTLAQLRWVSHTDQSFSFNPFSFTNVVNPFEAYAFEHFANSQWKASYHYCLRWFIDTPYSSRPAGLASYLAICMLKDYDSGVTLCEIGLRANPRNPVLLNNMVFAYAVRNDLDAAEQYVARIGALDQTTLEREQIIMLTATIALVEMRKGNLAQGKDGYKLALKLAKKIQTKTPFYRYMAIINFARELIVAKDPEMHEMLAQMNSLKIEAKFSDCIFLRQEVQKMKLP